MLAVVGLAVRSVAHGQSDNRREATALLMQIAGDLIRAALTAIAEEHFYAAATLSRQILEVTYLAQYFKIAPDRTAHWLTASDNELKAAQDFKLGALRQTVGAHGLLYSHHCALGGHPRHAAALLLPGSRWLEEDLQVPGPAGQIALAPQSALVTDLLQHTRPLLIACFESLAPSDLAPYITQTDRLVKAFVKWLQEDPLAWVGPHPDTP